MFPAGTLSELNYFVHSLVHSREKTLKIPNYIQVENIQQFLSSTKLPL